MKITGKILLTPFVIAALIVLGCIWFVVRIFLGLYSFCRVLFLAVMILGAINIIVCYHETNQIILFVLAIGASTVILIAGAAIQVLLEKAMKGMVIGLLAA